MSSPNPPVAELAKLISHSPRDFNKDKVTARLATLMANPGMIGNHSLIFTAGGRDVYITDVRRQGWMVGRQCSKESGEDEGEVVVGVGGK